MGSSPVTRGFVPEAPVCGAQEGEMVLALQGKRLRATCYLRAQQPWGGSENTARKAGKRSDVKGRIPNQH